MAAHNHPAPDMDDQPPAKRQKGEASDPGPVPDALVAAKNGFISLFESGALSGVSREEAVQAGLSAAAALRWALHTFPEPGFEEFHTQATIRGIYEGIGVDAADIKVVAQTGLTVDIRGTGAAGNDTEVETVCFRTDIDCLRMQEENKDLPYRSQKDGLAHMCGHDGHMAMATLTGVILYANRGTIPSGKTVRILYQPAEEGAEGGKGGAEPAIADGCLEGVNEIYGIHNWPQIPHGTLRTCVGPCMGHVASWDLKITGKGGHGSQPHVTIDAINCAAQVISGLNTIVSRNIFYQDTAVISVCAVNSGWTYNVIPDTTTMKGTIRDLNPSVFETLTSRMEAVISGICAAHGTEFEFEVHDQYPAVVNHEAETGHVVRVAQSLFGEDTVNDDELPLLAAEDFSYYLHHVPGCFFFLGGAEEGRTNAGCHNTSFDYNDNSTPYGVKMYLALADDRLGCSIFGS